MKYSWKAITCCVSKGVLVLLLIVSFLGGVIAVTQYTSNKQTAHCESLYHTIVTAEVSRERDQLIAQYENDCTDKPSSKMRETAGAITFGLIAFTLAALLLSAICSSNITYCQAAVETNRKPWYWLPKRLGGNPLPGRELKKCASCGVAKAESDEQYRARVVGSR